MGGVMKAKGAASLGKLLGRRATPLKREPRKRRPPAAFHRDFPIIQELRAKRDAPVDSVGCERLADSRASRANFEWQCLVAAMLSSQTKDQANAEAMAALRGHGNTVASVASTPVRKLDRLVAKVGFHATKAKNIKAAAKICQERHRGRVPSTVEELMALPGVGPKMAHLTMLAAFGAQEGLCVDVHVHRISNALGWITTRTPEETRKALEAWLPQEHWPHLNELLVGLGQQQQQQHRVLIERCLASSSPAAALRLAARIGAPLRADKLPELAEAARGSAAIRRLLE